MKDLRYPEVLKASSESCEPIAKCRFLRVVTIHGADISGGKDKVVVQKPRLNRALAR